MARRRQSVCHSEHEPVTVTVARAIHIGARRALGDGQTVVPSIFRGRGAGAEPKRARNPRRGKCLGALVPPVFWSSMSLEEP